MAWEGKCGGEGQRTAKFLGSINLDAGAEQHCLSLLLLKDLEHLLQEERAAHVGVKHKAALGVALEDCIAEVVEAAGGAQGSVLAQVADLEAGKLGAPLADGGSKDRFISVADQDDFLDGRHLCDRTQRVPEQWMAGHLEQQLPPSA